MLLVLTVSQIVMTSYSISSLKAPDEMDRVQLIFPFKDQGTYYILHGGNNEALNYHNKDPFQKHAIDIVKLNKNGTTYKSLFSAHLLEDFEIFGEEIFSPLGGKVIKVINELADEPYKNPNENNLGNLIIIEHRGIYLYLVHFKSGSIVVKEGDEVKEGAFLGKVGNSGNSSEPHLHMHAVRKRNGIESIPMFIDGSYLREITLLKGERQIAWYSDKLAEANKKDYRWRNKIYRIQRTTAPSKRANKIA